MDAKSQKLVADGNFEMLEILHHISSGMKAYVTDATYTGVDELRQSCGGASYLISSGIASLWVEHSPFITFEGVNVLM